MKKLQLILSLFSFSFIGSCAAQNETESFVDFIQANVESTYKKGKPARRICGYFK